MPVPITTMSALSQLHVGIVGLGRIGRNVAHRLKAFNCKISAFDPQLDASDIHGLGCQPATLDEVLEQSDVVTLHIPSTDATRKMISAARLAKFKPGSILINVSRGDLIETDALVDAFKSGKLSAAGLDVSAPEPIPAGHPLRSLENVVFTSHVASASLPAMLRLRSEVANIAALAANGKPVYNIVNGGPGRKKGLQDSRSLEKGTVLRAASYRSPEGEGSDEVPSYQFFMTAACPWRRVSCPAGSQINL